MRAFLHYSYRTLPFPPAERRAHYTNVGDDSGVGLEKTIRSEQLPASSRVSADSHHLPGGENDADPFVRSGLWTAALCKFLIECALTLFQTTHLALNLILSLMNPLRGENEVGLMRYGMSVGIRK